MILGLEFNDAFDLTAIGTIALATATFVSLWFARRSLNKTQDAIELAQSQLAQSREETELSRREVEEAHRPVVVPVVDRTSVMDLGSEGAGLERCPQMRAGGHLFVPVENIGAGPALNLEASIALPDEAGEPAASPSQIPAKTAGLRESAFTPLLIGLTGWALGPVPRFVLYVIYDDVAGKSWRTAGLYLPETGQYDGVTISPVERSRPLSDVLRPA